jgi:predicted negative regulator of RcsB-dependent stress response
VSEYLSEEEQLEQLRSFWKTWGLWLVAGVVVAIGGYGGWNWYEDYSRQQAEAAGALYQSWLDAGEDKDKLAAALKKIEAESPGSSYHGFVLLKQAADAVQAGKLEEAEPLLRQIVDKSAEPLLRSLASVRLAAVLQGLDKGDEALKLLDRVTGAGFKTAALEMKGDIHMARDEQAEAYKAYKAAFDSLKEGQKDSLLEAKVANAAPVPGAATKPAVDQPDQHPANETKADSKEEQSKQEGSKQEASNKAITGAANSADAAAEAAKSEDGSAADQATLDTLSESAPAAHNGEQPNE